MPFSLQNSFLAILMLILAANQFKEEEFVENALFGYSPAVAKGLIFRDFILGREKKFLWKHLLCMDNMSIFNWLTL